MGWTHNWKRPVELSAETFAKAVDDCRRALAATGIPLADADGSGQPVFAEDRIVFNGAAGAACEPFLVLRSQKERRGGAVSWSFCKTERAPYDLCVQVALIILKHHLGDRFVVGSDGRDEDWEAARQHCQQCLGYGKEFVLPPGETG